MRRFLIVVAAILFFAGQAFCKPTGVPLSLELMAQLRFPKPPLSEAEKRVLQNAHDGTEADCLRGLGGGGDPGKAGGTGEVPDEKWPETRNVRADLIRWLFVDREARKQVDPRGIQIRGARITGKLDLSFTNVPFPLALVSCRLQQGLDVSWAKMPVLDLEGSWTGEIDADGLKLEGELFLTKGFHAEGEVRLIGATIRGNLEAAGGTFKNSDGDALSADGIKVNGAVFLRDGFSAEGTVRLLNAAIGSDLDATRGTFKNPSAKGHALYADGIKVTGSVYLRNGFNAEGEVSLLGATIGGILSATGGTFQNPNGDALDVDRIKVTGSVFLNDKFVAEGDVRLPGATIGGNLEADGGTFKKPSGNALNPDGTKNETALDADGIKVTRNVFLRKGFVAVGQAWLRGAEVKGQLASEHAWLDKLDLESAHITGKFFWQNIHKDRHPDFPNKEWQPSLNLTDATVGPLADQEASWPDKGRLRLDGFVYDRIGDGPTDATARLRWLRLQDGYRPQPYEQLIAVLRQMGREDQVAEVGIAKQWDMRKLGHLGWLSWIWNWFLYFFVGYGYRPWLAFVWMAILVMVGARKLSRAHCAGVLVPSDKQAYEEYEESKKLPAYYPRFQALLYSLDIVLPFDLGQKSNWRLIDRWPGDLAYRRYQWCSVAQLILGWILLLIAAGVTTGLIK